MLTTKEHVKQIEMDTIQQEPLFTELTSEAAAIVEGGILFKVVNVDPGSTLTIRSGPSTTTRKIGSLRPGQLFQASTRVTTTFRKLLGRAGWVARRYIQRV